MKKGDIVIVCTIATTLVLSIVLLIFFSKQGSQVVIKQDNSVVYEQSINKNNIVNTESNIIVIKDGAVYMQESNCKNQICVKSDKISKKGESIVCLPNRVIVEIK